MKYISIIGSTGSIGTQTLELVRANEDLAVTTLAAGSNVDLLERQIREFHPHTAVLYDKQRAEELRLRVKDLEVKVLSGPEGLTEAASEQSC